MLIYIADYGIWVDGLMERFR